MTFASSGGEIPRLGPATTTAQKINRRPPRLRKAKSKKRLHGRPLLGVARRVEGSRAVVPLGRGKGGVGGVVRGAGVRELGRRASASVASLAVPMVIATVPVSVGQTRINARGARHRRARQAGQRRDRGRDVSSGEGGLERDRSSLEGR
jgi:hypothetical protein